MSLYMYCDKGNKYLVNGMVYYIRYIHNNLHIYTREFPLKLDHTVYKLEQMYYDIMANVRLTVSSQIDTWHGRFLCTVAGIFTNCTN